MDSLSGTDAVELAYDVVDVFTDPDAPGYSGNQLAVVHGTAGPDGAGLDDDALLALAREFGYSETTFPTPGGGAGGAAGGGGAAYDVRIFTPGGEIPFAGHPTLGTAWVLAARGLVEGPDLVQHCAAGDVAVTLGEAVELSARPGDVIGPLPDDVVARMLADVGLGVDDRDGDAWLCGTGLDFVHLPVTDDAVVRARPGSTPLDELSGDWVPEPAATTAIGGLDLYAVTARPGESGGEDHVEVHSRVFVPELSVPEDSATGSAATGLGLALVARGVLPAGGTYRIGQGREMERPSVLHGTVVVSTAGTAELVRVAGGVRAVAHGSIALPVTPSR